MNLAKYYGKSVEIQGTDGTVYIGVVNDYIELEDSGNGKESIIIDTIPRANAIEFYEADIKRIEVIDK